MSEKDEKQADRCESSAAGLQCRRDKGHDGQHSAKRGDDKVAWD